MWQGHRHKSRDIGLQPTSDDEFERHCQYALLIVVSKHGINNRPGYNPKIHRKRPQSSSGCRIHGDDGTSLESKRGVSVSYCKQRSIGGSFAESICLSPCVCAKHQKQKSKWRVIYRRDIPNLAILISGISRRSLISGVTVMSSKCNSHYAGLSCCLVAICHTV